MNSTEYDDYETEKMLNNTAAGDDWHKLVQQLLLANDSSPSEFSTMEEEALGGFEPPSTALLLLHHTAIICFTLLGNILLVLVILSNNRATKRKRVTPVQMLMLHMCVADLLFALITILPSMWLTYTVPYFYGPDLLCKFIKYLQVLPMYASSFLLVAISADRYMAICKPLESMRNSSAYSRPALFAAIAWALAFLLCTPQLFLFKKLEEEDGDCVGAYTSPHQYTVYVIVFNMVVWLFPSAIAGYLYYRVCQAVWKSAQGVHEKSPSTNLKLHSSGNEIHTVQNLELDRRRIQTVKLTLTIVAANFILWAPFCITSVVDAVCPQCINPAFATYILFFGNLNSCMNPWIWFYFNRSQIKRALRCHSVEQPLLGFSRRSRTSQNMDTYINENQVETGASF